MEDIFSDFQKNSAIKLKFERAFKNSVKKKQKQNALMFLVKMNVKKICENPMKGKPAKGKLKGKRICKFILERVHYRIVYELERSNKRHANETNQPTLIFHLFDNRGDIY